VQRREGAAVAHVKVRQLLRAGSAQVPANRHRKHLQKLPTVTRFDIDSVMAFIYLCIYVILGTGGGQIHTKNDAVSNVPSKYVAANII
jgi:hypothetical protein